MNADDLFTSALDLQLSTKNRDRKDKKQKFGIHVRDNPESEEIAKEMVENAKQGLCMKCGIYRSMGFCERCMCLMSYNSERLERAKRLSSTVEQIIEDVKWIPKDLKEFNKQI